MLQLSCRGVYRFIYIYIYLLSHLQISFKLIITTLITVLFPIFLHFIFCLEAKWRFNGTMKYYLSEHTSTLMQHSVFFSSSYKHLSSLPFLSNFVFLHRNWNVWSNIVFKYSEEADRIFSSLSPLAFLPTALSFWNTQEPVASNIIYKVITWCSKDELEVKTRKFLMFFNWHSRSLSLFVPDGQGHTNVLL